LLKARMLIYIILPFIYVANLFFKSSGWDWFITILAAISVLISVVSVRSIYLVSSLVFIATGTAIYASYPITSMDLNRSFHSTIGVLGIFLVIPFIQFMIHIGKYDKSLNRLITYRVRQVSGIYRRISFGTYLLAIFLTIATLPVGVHTFSKKLPFIKGEEKQIFLSRAMLRAYSLALLWSPVELIVVVTVDYTHTQYLILLPLLLASSVVTLGVDWLVQGKHYSQPLAASAVPIQAGAIRRDVRKLAQLLLAVILLLLVVLYVDHWLKTGLLVAIILTLLPFSFVWSLCLRKSRHFGIYVKNQWMGSVKGLPNFHAMFLSAGFLISMAQRSELSTYLSDFLHYSSDHLHLFVFLLLISGLFWILSFSGFHAVVTIILLTEILLPAFAGFEHVLSLVLIGTQMSLITISPFNVATSMMSSLIQVSPLRLVQWNVLYAACFVVGFDAFAYAIVQWG